LPVYVLTKDGKRLAFAAYVNHVSLAPDPEAAQHVAGQALGEIAAAAYDANLEASGGAGDYDLIIRNGHIIDGTGNPWYAADVGVSGDRVATIGDLHEAHAKREIDATAASSLLASLTCLDSPKFLSPRQSFA